MKAFEKIIGYQSIKNELYQIIDMFKNRELYEKMGAKTPHGILLFGAPGLGKSLLCEALIEECGVKTFVVKPCKDEKETIQEIANVFSQAAEQDSIIWFDDIDKLSDSDDFDVDDKAFVAIQTGIDSVKDKNVLVLATANNVAKLPQSLKRSGRFDRKIHVITPSSEDAGKIIEYFLSKKNVDKNINMEDIVKMISYSSCADLERLVNESAIYSTYARKEHIDIDDIVKAYLRDEYSVNDESYKCSEEEIELTSLHEAGHTVIAEVLKQGGVGLVNVSATDCNEMAGFTRICERYKRRPENILIGLGGKAAVEMFYQGKCASGCQSDINRVCDMIRDGLSESGTCGLAMIDVANQRFPNTSESLNSRNEAVTQAELERYMFMARDILLKNKDFLVKVTEALKQKRTLLFSDIKKIRETVQITPYNLIS